MTNYKPNSKIAHYNMKQNPEISSFKGLLHRNKMSAKGRGLSWHLSLEQYMELCKQPCVWCGLEPTELYNVSISKNGTTQRKFKSYMTENGWIKYNGLDRIDNDKPYEYSNVRPCCKYCNFARNDQSQEDFKIWITRIVNFTIKQEMSQEAVA